MMNSKLFAQLESHEVLKGAWSDKDPEVVHRDAATITRIIQFTNRVCAFLASLLTEALGWLLDSNRGPILLRP